MRCSSMIKRQPIVSFAAPEGVFHSFQFDLGDLDLQLEFKLLTTPSQKLSPVGAFSLS